MKIKCRYVDVWIMYPEQAMHNSTDFTTDRKPCLNI